MSEESSSSADDFDLMQRIERNMSDDALMQYPLIPASWYAEIIMIVMASFPSMPEHLVKEYLDVSLKIQYYKLLVESCEPLIVVAEAKSITGSACNLRL